MIVLDTHAWVWWVSEPGRIPPPARTAIEEAVEVNALYVSAISIWEVARLVSEGRLTLTLPVSDWVSLSEAIPFLNFVPVDNTLALRSALLEDFPNTDIADRLILATAIALDATVVTSDWLMWEYPGVRTLWMG